MKRREEILSEWDYWRERIQKGNTSSAPRDWFESVLDEYDELLQEIYDNLTHTEEGGPCPVCWTYTHKSWCYYNRLKAFLK